MPGPSDEPHVTPATATETSALLHTGPPVPFDAKHHVLSSFNGMLVIVVWVAVIGALCFLSTTTLRNENPGNSLGVIVNNDNDRPFPSDFVWGVATSAYQIEGAVTEDGRGVTIWDTFVLVPGAVADNSTGVTADDHYHRWKDDVALMKSLHVTAYRFSIAWSRILPTGRGTINAAGIRFYETLIDELLANDIEPWITLFHWDLPQSLQDDFGGWLDHRTVDAFADYARVVFQSFCPKVKRFITLNEPWT
jgi:Glycosyl hydrolase family 1